MSGGYGAGGESRPWLAGIEPVLDCLAADIRSDLGREPDTGDLLLVLLNSLNTIAAEATRDSIQGYASLKETIDQLRIQRITAERESQQRLDRLTREKEAAIAARDFERAEQLHNEQIQLRLEGQRILDAWHTMVIDFSRRVLGITDAFGNRLAAG
jgi:hypothetical protein